MSAYVVIKERGQYSSFSYVPLVVFSNEDDAYAYVNVLTTKQENQNKIASMRGELVKECDFIVQKVLVGNEQMLDEENCKINNEELQRACEWQNERNKQLAQEKLQLEAQHDTIAENFLDWWETGMHKNPAFDSVGRIRREGLIVQKYALKTLDERAMAWCHENKDKITYIPHAPRRASQDADRRCS